MWLYLLGIPLVPYLGYRYMLYCHNRKMVESLKTLNKYPKAMAQPKIQEVVREIINLID